MDCKFTLKQARAYRGLTLDEMAGKINVTVNTYRQKEKNPQNISVELAQKISSALQIPMDDLIFLPVNTL